MKVTAVTVSNVKAHLFIDAKGNTNFDVVETDTTDKDTAFELPFDLINLHKISIKNLNADFTDQFSGLYASINGLTAQLKGKLTVEDAWAKLHLESGAIRLNENSISIAAKLNSFETKIEAKKSGPNIHGTSIWICLKCFRMDTTVYAKGLPLTLRFL